jgi:chromosome segregation and condensation protein ScpB
MAAFFERRPILRAAPEEAQGLPTGALEVLAVIAFRYSITRPETEAVRG